MFARRKALQSAVGLARLASAPSERLATTSTLGEAISKVKAFVDLPNKTATWKLSLGFAAAGACTMMTSAIAMAEEGSTATVSKSTAIKGGSPKASQAQKYKVVFVLGGPGSGKGTQSTNLVEEFGANVVHLSAGDLLRAHMESGTPDGKMVADMIAQGQIVPSHVTISLLQAAMDASGKTQFLIDGFPRNEENRSAFEAQTGIEPTFILFFECSEQEMEKRLLARNQGRTDDNIETIRKRFRVFMESSLPVVKYYEKTGKVARINAARPPEEVYKEVKRIWLEFMQ